MVMAGGSASAQNGLRMSPATPRPSGSFIQRPVGSPVSSARRPLIGLSGTPLHDAARRRQGFARNSFVYGGWPYWPSEYYGDSNEPDAALQPPAPAPAPVAETRPEPVPSAVLLELQGNQWVKVSAFATAAPAKSVAPEAARELPPAVIVYRDGHSEELSSYSIMGTTLYAKADYLATGTWTRKVQLADLDLPQTVKQNQQRGLKFDLPSGPNEIVLRP